MIQIEFVCDREFEVKYMRMNLNEPTTLNYCICIGFSNPITDQQSNILNTLKERSSFSRL